MNQYVFAAASLPIMDSQPTFKGRWMDPMRRAVLVLLLMVGVGIGGRHAVLADSYDFTVIDVPESSYTGAYGINDRGEIVGASYTDAYDSPGLHGSRRMPLQGSMVRPVRSLTHLIPKHLSTASTI